MACVQGTGTSAYSTVYSPLNQSEPAVRIGYGRIHEQRLTLNPIESSAIALQPLASVLCLFLTPFLTGPETSPAPHEHFQYQPQM